MTEDERSQIARLRDRVAELERANEALAGRSVDAVPYEFADLARELSTRLESVRDDTQAVVAALLRVQRCSSVEALARETLDVVADRVSCARCEFHVFRGGEFVRVAHAGNGRESAAENVAAMLAGLDSCEPGKIRCTRRAAGGDCARCETIVVPCPDGSGHPVGALVLFAEAGRPFDEHSHGLLATAGTLVGAALELQRTRALDGRSQSLFEELAQSSPFGVYVHRDGIITYVNPALGRMLGYDADGTHQAVGRPILEYVHPDDRDWTSARIVRRMRGEDVPGTSELRLIHCDGSVVWTSCTVSCTTDGGALSIVGHLVDITERKRAEEREERALAILEGTRDIVMTINREGRVLSLNQAGLRAMGLGSDQEASQRSIWDMAPPHEAARVRWELLPALLQKNELRGEGVYFDRRGEEVRDMAFNAFRLPASDGGAGPEFAIVLTDVSVLRRAEDALEASEARYRLLTEHQQDVLVAINPNGIVTYCSPAVRAFGGYEPSDAEGTHLAQYVHPDDRGTMLGEVARMAKERRPVTVIFRYVAASGATFPVEVTGVPVVTEGQLQSIQCIMRDITERHRALEEQRAAAERLRAQGAALHDFATAADGLEEGLQPALVRLLESATEALSVVRVSCWGVEPGRAGSEQWRCLARYERPGEPRHDLDAVDGDTLSGLHWPAERRRAYGVPDVTQGLGPDELIERIFLRFGIGSALMAAVHVRGMPVGFVLATCKIRGREWHTDEEWFISAVADQVAHVLLDEERRLAHEERAHLEEQLQHSQKMEAIGRLASGVAHDFNNVLTTIVGQCDFLLETVPDVDPLRADLEEIQGAAERATWLTGQLLSFSRRQTVEPRAVDLRANLQDTERMIGRIIGEDVEPTFDWPAELWTVWVDPGQVDQILLNLAANARDAMPDGGQLMVRACNTTIDEIEALRWPDVMPGEFVCLSVRDTGVGIPYDDRERVFDPFFTTKEPGKGTGLGLSTVYGVARQNGGFVSLESEVGEGTEFRIHFPRFAGIVPEPDAGYLSVRGFGGRESILIAEDEVMVRRLVQRALEDAGYFVLSASCGEEALALAAADPDRHIDLLLTDVVMPGMSGQVLQEKLREARPELAVLYMSGYPEDVLSEHGALSESTLLLEKPFSATRLRQRVRAVLDSNRV